MKSFTISPPPGDPPTLQNNTGKVTFTVTNTATRTVSGTVMAKPTAPAQESWFSFAEGATRNYQPGAVMSVATTITVPAGTAEGTYTFRLDAKAEDNPDEDYTEGPSAQFILPAPPKPVPWWKRYWWIIAIAAVVLIGIVLAIVLFTRGSGVPERACVKIDAAAVKTDQNVILGRFARFDVSAGQVNLGRYANQQDAARVEQLAKAFERRCQIAGVEYWLDETGSALPSRDDCFEYDPEKVVTEPSGSRFVVRDPGAARPLGSTPSQAEADDLKAVAAAFRRRCFIGRNPNIDDEVEEVEDAGGRLPGGGIRDLFRTTTMDYWEE